MKFTAEVIKGSGRGKSLGTPTLNLDTTKVPQEVAEGVYAIFAFIEGEQHDAVMHYGPRPVFRDTLSCEIHLINEPIEHVEVVTVHVLERLRDVADFPTPDDLRMQIALDIQNAREIIRNAHH